MKHVKRKFSEEVKNQNVRLPSPPRRPEEEWLPAVRVGRTIPFGYKEDPKDSMVLLPVVEELELLEHAKELLREYSLRTVAHWLSEKSGRPISHTGLSKRIKLETTRKALAGQYRRYARLYKEAAEKAQALETQVGGSKVRSHPYRKDQYRLWEEQKEWDKKYGTSDT